MPVNEARSSTARLDSVGSRDDEVRPVLGDEGSTVKRKLKPECILHAQCNTQVVADAHSDEQEAYPIYSSTFGDTNTLNEAKDKVTKLIRETELNLFQELQANWRKQGGNLETDRQTDSFYFSRLWCRAENAKER